MMLGRRDSRMEKLQNLGCPVKSLERKGSQCIHPQYKNYRIHTFAQPFRSQGRKPRCRFRVSLKEKTKGKDTVFFWSSVFRLLEICRRSGDSSNLCFTQRRSVGVAVLTGRLLISNLGTSLQGAKHISKNSIFLFPHKIIHMIVFIYNHIQ